jgi:hypothetical protein
MLFAWDALLAGEALRAAALGTAAAPTLGLAGLLVLILPALFLATGWLWSAAEAAQEQDWRTDTAAGLAGMGTAQLRLCAGVSGVVGLLFALLGMWTSVLLGLASAAGLLLGAAAFLGFAARCLLLARDAAKRERRMAQRRTRTRI